MLRKLLNYFRSSRGKEPSVPEIVANVEKGGSYMRVVPQVEADLELMLEQASQYRGSKQYEKSVEILNKVLDIFPNHFGAYIDRGLSYHLLGITEKAITDYSKAITINPRYYIAHVNLASVYIDLGRKEEALKLYREVLAIIPSNRQTDVAEVNRLMNNLSKQGE
ncbi:tetratricopeptide repeat protein [bacterium]|nr:MAG: tetratricopeptide repeat protein [bacterium]